MNTIRMMLDSDAYPRKMMLKLQRRGVRRAGKRGGEIGVHVEKVEIVMTEGTAKTKVTQVEKAVSANMERRKRSLLHGMLRAVADIADGRTVALGLVVLGRTEIEAEMEIAGEGRGVIHREIERVPAAT